MSGQEVAVTVVVTKKSLEDWRMKRINSQQSGSDNHMCLKVGAPVPNCDSYYAWLAFRYVFVFGCVLLVPLTLLLWS